MPNPLRKVRIPAHEVRPGDRIGFTRRPGTRVLRRTTLRSDGDQTLGYRFLTDGNSQAVFGPNEIVRVLRATQAAPAALPPVLSGCDLPLPPGHYVTNRYPSQLTPGRDWVRGSDGVPRLVSRVGKCRSSAGFPQWLITLSNGEGVRIPLGRMVESSRRAQTEGRHRAPEGAGISRARVRSLALRRLMRREAGLPVRKERYADQIGYGAHPHSADYILHQLRRERIWRAANPAFDWFTA